jgi:hypothetical protein
VGLIDRIDVANDPVNFIDPEGLLFGINAGESYGESAAQYYANITVDPCASKLKKAGAWVGGLLSSLWTSNTSNQTALTLAGGGLAGRIANMYHVAKDGWHIGALGYHSIGKTVITRNLGRGYEAGKYLHANIAGKHFIVVAKKIVQQIKYWKFAK